MAGSRKGRKSRKSCRPMRCGSRKICVVSHLVPKKRKSYLAILPSGKKVRVSRHRVKAYCRSRSRR